MALTPSLTMGKKAGRLGQLPRPIPSHPIPSSVPRLRRIKILYCTEYRKESTPCMTTTTMATDAGTGNERERAGGRACGGG